MPAPFDTHPPGHGGDNNLAGPPGSRTPVEIARDHFWAARKAGDRCAMTVWSARENTLRRAAHGALPDAGPQSWVYWPLPGST